MEAGSEDNMCLKKNRDAAGPQRLQRDAGSAQLVPPLHSMWRECPLEACPWGFILGSQTFAMGFNLDLIFFLLRNTKENILEN